MLRTKALREARAKLILDAQAILDKDVATPEDFAQFDAMMADADVKKAHIDRIEAANTVSAEQARTVDVTARARGVSGDELRAEQDLESLAFRNYLRVGMGGLNDEERPIAQRRFSNALSTGTSTAGGYTVPQGFYDVLTDALKAYGGMLNVATVIDTETGNALPLPTDNDTANSGAILTENTQVSTQDVTFGAITLNAYTYTSKLVLVSNQLLQDSAFNLESFLANKLGTRLGRAINTHFTVGSGTGQPNGAVTASVSGKVGVVGETTSLIFDDLVDLEHAVDPAYRANGKFMMNDLTLRSIKKLKDTQGRPLFLPGFAEKEPDTINGMPYVINQDMPVMAANAKSVLFGDFSTYLIRRVAGTQVLRLTERYADFNQTGFLAFQRWDGNLLDAGSHPLAYFANSAS